MIERPAAPAIVRGIVHCHTDLSYDGRVSLAALCETLRREGFHFVALTEHDRGITADRYEAYVAECRRLSDDDFVAIPGLEVLCDAGVEIAGVGLTRLVEPGPPDEVAARIRDAGGYAIWVHPVKRGPALEDRDCDAIEVLNGKVDGDLSPNLRLVEDVARRRRRGEGCHAIFGLDLHGLEQSRNIWVDCRVDRLGQAGILSALRAGRFVNRVAGGDVPSSGELDPLRRMKLSAFRMAATCWNAGLERMPRGARDRIRRLGRPLIARLKQPRTR